MQDSSLKVVLPLVLPVLMERSLLHLEPPNVPLVILVLYQMQKAQSVLLALLEPTPSIILVFLALQEPSLHQVKLNVVLAQAANTL